MNKIIIFLILIMVMLPTISCSSKNVPDYIDKQMKQEAYKIEMPDFSFYGNFNKIRIVVTWLDYPENPRAGWEAEYLVTMYAKSLDDKIEYRFCMASPSYKSPSIYYIDSLPNGITRAEIEKHRQELYWRQY